MKNLLLAIALSLCTLIAWALDVECTPGNLENLVTDKSITSLTITGSMDARDFKFISTELEQLTTVDLSQATIVEYTSAKPLFCNDTFYPAGVIPAMSFFDKPITTVTLPQSVKGIGMAAFAGCRQLSEFNFHEGIDSIAAYAFSGTALGAANLPSSIKTLGTGVFSRCINMISASITPVTSAFIVPKDAFHDCRFLSVLTLGPNVEVLADGALSGTERLTAITFPSENNIRSIGTATFMGSGITNFFAKASNNLTSIKDWAFAGSKQVSAPMPAAVKELGKGVFYYAQELTSFVPNSLITKLDDYLLAGTAVANDNAPGTVTDTIGDRAFYNTPATSLTLPATLKYIGTEAMAGMTELQSLTSNAADVPELGDDVWAGVNQEVIPLYVPATAFNAYNEAMQWQNFLLTRQGIFGDVNCDGQVTGSDVTALYNYILYNNTTYFETSDVNGDGSVTGSDITAVYNIILGLSKAPRHPSCKPTTDVLTAADFTINAGETYWLELNMNNETAYTTMQFDIDMPQGLSITDVKTTTRSKGAFVGYNEVAPGKWRILASTSGNITWSGNQGAIFSIEVQASDSYSGNEIINFNNIIAVEPSEDSHLIDELNVGVSNTTGVKDINIDDTTGDSPVDVYNMNGQLLRKAVERDNATTGLPAGIYIVGGKKVMVK